MALNLDYNGDGRVSPADDHQTYNRMHADEGDDGCTLRGCSIVVGVVVFLAVIFIAIFIFG